MDDSTESDVLYEAASILVKLSARSIKGIRADIDQIELQNLLTVEEPTLTDDETIVNSHSFSFMPMIVGLFALGLIAAAFRNQRIQAWALLMSRLLRRWTRKIKTFISRMLVQFGPVRQGDLLQLHLKSPGSTWDLRSSSGRSACFALQGRRPKMEDRFTLVEKLGNTPLHLFAIYDGHGGEFAADFAQRWIVNWLEKRSANYKSKPAMLNSQTSIPSSPSNQSGVQEIVIEDTEGVAANTADSTSSDKEATTKSTKNSNGSQLEPLAVQAEPKTPTIKRRLAQNEGQGESSAAQYLRSDSNEKKDPPRNDFRRRSSANSARSIPIPSPSKRPSVSLGTEFDLSNELTTAIMESDKALLVEAKKLNDVAGSTALVAILDSARGQLAVANVGDSRGILCDTKGTVIPLSFDHKPQQLKERKRIQEAGGFISFNGVWRVAGILATSRALGDFPLKDRKLLISEPDVLSFDLSDLRLHQPSFLILASDGLWDAFSNEEAAFYIRQRLHEPHLGAKSLAMQAYQRGSVDNITVLVINLSRL